jgi:hypothetical protein
MPKKIRKAGKACIKSTVVRVRGDKAGNVHMTELSKGFTKLQAKSRKARKGEAVPYKAVVEMEIDGKRHRMTIHLAAKGLRSLKGEERKVQVRRLFAVIAAEVRLDHDAITMGSFQLLEPVRKLRRLRTTAKKGKERLQKFYRVKHLKRGGVPRVAKIKSITLCEEKRK